MNAAYNHNIRDCSIIRVVAADTLTPVPLLLTPHKVDMNAAYNYNKTRDCRIIRVVAADTLTPGPLLLTSHHLILTQHTTTTK